MAEILGTDAASYPRRTETNPVETLYPISLRSILVQYSCVYSHHLSNAWVISGTEYGVLGKNALRELMEKIGVRELQLHKIYFSIPNYNQQDATFLGLFIFTDALHVSGCFSAYHQEHITVHTASGIVNQYCCTVLVDNTWL